MEEHALLVETRTSVHFMRTFLSGVRDEFPREPQKPGVRASRQRADKRGAASLQPDAGAERSLRIGDTSHKLFGVIFF